MCCPNCEHPCSKTVPFHHDDPPYLSKLLLTNDTPQEVMLGPLKASALRVTTALDETDAEIRRLKVQEDKRRHLEEVGNGYKSALSPLRRFPVEILVEMFYAFAREKGYYDVFSRTGPWALSRVCRRWRHVALSLCPSIWATMSVTASRYNPISLLKTAVSRSGGCKLDFTLSGLDSDPFACLDFLPVLLAHSERWRSAYFTRQPLVIQQLSSIRGKIPNLEVCHIDTDPLCIYAGRLNVFEFAPSLKHLHLKRLLWQSVIPVTAPNLISFSDDQTSHADSLHSTYLDIIRASPYLETFDIQYQDQNGELPVVTPRILHSALQSLTVCEAAFISSLELPMLKSIEICRRVGSRAREDQHTAADVLPALHDLISVSSCSLTRLIISDTVLQDHVISILKLCPSLSNRRWTEWSYPD
ncbi:hypothetical protein ARMSODRAFT_330877 [Armillaria solidipes]|uniref:F-box domain-containing protein n=1 Tax=Armillaria solidipes TaxID=1076256 RepID=A0A2H3BV20_9AGAR|nr:hypothetical protein ARMSODRAFT_330877 [Armillaria solidipes]